VQLHIMFQSHHLISLHRLGLQYTAEPLLGAGLAFALLGERCASNAHGRLTFNVALQHAATLVSM
jgi:hypothetical protein